MKIKLIVFLFFTANSVYSQNSLDLLVERDSLKTKKTELLNRISQIDNKIELLNFQIEFALLKEKSAKTTIKRNSSFYKTPDQINNIIENVKVNDVIYIIEHYKYSKYYKAIYNDKIGFVKEKDIRETKEIKSINKNQTESTSSLINNSQNFSNKRVSTYRTYYRGPRGGCYYINSKGNKTYVDRSLCN